MIIVLPLLVGLLMGVLWRGLDGSGQDGDKYFPLRDKAFPAMTLLSFDGGKKITADELRQPETAMVINVFASWCVPCVAEMPFLKKIKPSLTKMNVSLVGINWRDKKSDAQRFLKTNGNPFDKLLVDSDGTAMINIGLVGVPETYFVDKQGMVRYRKIGPMLSDNDMADLLAAIKQWQ